MSTPDPDTISLDSRINHTVQIYGRTYQEVALEKGTSFSPVDDEERDRLNRIHEILQLMFAGKLLFPPVSNPRRVLDCGYGSGAWCVGVAEAYPECEVIGVDVSPHMKPDDIPANVWLQVDDLNEPFTFQSNHFDLIHSRNVVTGINIGRWQSYIQDCVRYD
jgi:SAM-dependent methyltransferase